MTTGYIVTGRGDLDVLFKPRVAAAIANTNYLSNGGVDLAQRFEPRGTATPIANTNFVAGSSDLAQLFKDINAGTVLVASQNYTDSTASSGRNADAAYGITGDGDVLRILNFSSLDDGDWIAPKAAGPGGGYSVRATIVSGSQSSGDAVSTWLTLGTGVTYQWHTQRLSVSGPGTNTLTLTIEVRDASTTIVSTGTIVLNAQLT